MLRLPLEEVLIGAVYIRLNTRRFTQPFYINLKNSG